ncbi:uncharacterized protein IUM83_12644 [Phytophthora cinnamomi]|uniref:uncharacterized protein n=1 Tax=Phytophthora cinnamomi TaxID=4785 RepID=UPI003559E546|nr:hypothetical protein IUM83_12644 [Phytophthora cinnamomi]
MVNYRDRDWNLLAASNDTLSVINNDDSPIISAAKIFKYLQTLKERADVEHDVMIYRYGRTFQCASEGLKMLAKDAVTDDEYQWMYDLYQPAVQFMTKLADCIEEASGCFGYKQDQRSNDDPSDHLKQANAWVQDTCMAS